MNRYIALYDHPNWTRCHAMVVIAETKEAAEEEAQRKLDDREPLGWYERKMERVPWQPGIRFVQVLSGVPIKPDDEGDIIPF